MLVYGFSESKGFISADDSCLVMILIGILPALVVFNQKETKNEEIKEKVLKLKLELEEAIKSRESGEKGMDNITTHREYEALEKQISEATDKENDVRKELQKEEKFLEELKETLKSDEEMIKSQEDDISSAKKSIDNEEESYFQLSKSSENLFPEDAYSIMDTMGLLIENKQYDIINNEYFFVETNISF